MEELDAVRLTGEGKVVEQYNADNKHGHEHHELSVVVYAHCHDEVRKKCLDSLVGSRLPQFHTHGQ